MIQRMCKLHLQWYRFSQLKKLKIFNSIDFSSFMHLCACTFIQIMYSERAKITYKPESFKRTDLSKNPKIIPACPHSFSAVRNCTKLIFQILITVFTKSDCLVYLVENEHNGFAMHRLISEAPPGGLTQHYRHFFKMGEHGKYFIM